MNAKFFRIGALVLLVLGALFLFAPKTVLAATITSAGDGNWNSTTPNAPWPGGVVPAATDDVVIRPGDDITVTADATINSITFSNTTTINRILTVNSGVTLSVTAGITLQNAAGATNTNATMAGAGTITCASLQVGGTVVAPNLTGDATTTLTTTISNLSISGNLSLIGVDDGGDDNNPTLNLQSGSVSVGGSVVLNEPPGSAVTLTMATGAQTGTLTLSGATPFTITGSPTFTANGTGATVIYSSSGAQTILAATYTNLTLSGSGTKTPSAGFRVDTDLAIDSGVTLNVAGFTILLSSATITVNGTLDFTDAGGEVQSIAGSSILTIGSTGLIRTLDAAGLGPTSTFTNASLQTNGGTWTTTSIDTNGTVEYNRNATSGQTVTDRNYNNLTITGATQTKTWTLTATRTVNGNVTINTGAPLTLAGGQILNVKGNWLNDGTLTAGASTVAFNGTAAQTIGGANATTFNALTINNAAGVTLNANATVNGLLTLTTDLTTGTNTLTQGTGTTCSGTGDVVGNTTRTDLVVGTPRCFGNTNVQITVNAGATPPTAMTVDLQKHVPNDFANAVIRQYTLTPTGGNCAAGSNCTVRLRYLDSELNGNTETACPPVGANLLSLWRFGASWGVVGVTACDSTANWVEQAGVTSFSRWAISNASSSPTAAILTAFSAKAKTSTRVKVKWESGSNMGIIGFNVQRATKRDGNYKTLKSVTADPTDPIGHNYKFVDKTVKSGKAYFYRIEILKADTTTELSDVIKVKVP